MNADTKPFHSLRIETVSNIVLIGAAFSITFHYVLSAYLHLGYPFSTFLFNPDDRFNDYRNLILVVKDFSPYHSAHWFNSNYFPFGNLFLILFSFLGNPNVSLIVFITIFLVLYLWIIRFIDKTLLPLSLKDKVILYSFNYPMLFALDRANIELYVFLATVIFAYFYVYKKNDTLSIVLLAVAIAAKLYPAVYLVIFLRDRKYSNIAWTLFLVLVLSFFSLSVFQGGVIGSIENMFHAFGEFNVRMMGMEGVHHNASIYGIVKILAIGLLKAFPRHREWFPQMFDFENYIYLPYAVFAFVSFAAVSFFLVKRRVSNHECWLVLTVLMILLPNVSHDYKLINLLIPLLFFFMEKDDGPKIVTYAVLYGLLLIPKDYVILFRDVSIASLINPVLLIILLLVVFAEGRGPKPEPST